MAINLETILIEVLTELLQVNQVVIQRVIRTSNGLLYYEEF